MIGFIEDFRRGHARARAAHDGDSARRKKWPPTPIENALDEVLKISAALQEEITRLEAERDALPAKLLAEVLRFPGVREALLLGHHPDKHPRATPAEKREFTERTAKINAAYEAIERGASS